MAEKPKSFEELNTTMGLAEFELALFDINKKGHELTQKHHKLYGRSKEDKLEGGRRYHAPATDLKCPYCKPILEAYEETIKLQTTQIGVTGIPFDSLMAAIKVTRATVKMMKNGGEL